jgi:hypothetical protein
MYLEVRLLLLFQLDLALQMSRKFQVILDALGIRVSQSNRATLELVLPCLPAQFILNCRFTSPSVWLIFVKNIFNPPFLLEIQHHQELL